jgi:hypothetical protein
MDEARARLRRLRFVRSASRAWLTLPDRGEGLVIAVALDDPASEPAREAVIGALLAAVASVPLHVPYPVDVVFPGEPAADDEPVSGDVRAGGGGRADDEPVSGDQDGGERRPDVIAEWLASNTRPFYTRD